MDSSVKARMCPGCSNYLNRQRDLFVAEAERRNISVLEGHCLTCTKDDLKRRIILAQENRSETSRIENEEDRKRRVAEKQQKEEVLPGRVANQHLTRTEVGKILRLTTVEIDGLSRAGLLYFSGSLEYRKRRVPKESLRSLLEAVIDDPTLKSDDFGELPPVLSRRLIKRVDYFAKLYTSGVLDD